MIANRFGERGGDGEMFIVTHSGQRFYYDRPETFEFSLSEIGYALGNLCRFSGQHGWWSVAQHSLFVSDLLEQRDQLRGLLHDASEAFMVDVPGPLKQMSFMSGYKELEGRVMKAIHRQFGIPEDEQAEQRVKRADMIAFKAEANMLGMNPQGWDDWPLVPVGTYLSGLQNGQAGKEFERRALWLLEQ